MTSKQKSRKFIFGGSAVIGFVIGTIFVEAAFGVVMAVLSPLISFATQYIIKSFKEGIKDLKSKGIMPEASDFSKTPAEFVEKYNSEVDLLVEMATEPKEGSHRKRKQVDCSALKIVKTVEQTPDSGYFQLQDAPYIKIHWIKGQSGEWLKGVAFAFAMKTVRQVGVDHDGKTTFLPVIQDDTVFIQTIRQVVRQDGVDIVDATPFLPEIRYGEEETETIFIHVAVIQSMIQALYDYSMTGAQLTMLVSSLATNSIDPEDLGWKKVWNFQREVNEYVLEALDKVSSKNAEAEAAQNKNKAAQGNPKTFSAESREEFEFEGVSFVVIVSNQLSLIKSKSNVWIVATKDAGIERRLENEIIGR